MRNVLVQHFNLRGFMLLLPVLLCACEGVSLRSVSPRAQRTSPETAPFSHHFDFDTASSYAADATLEFASNSCRLQAADLTDDSASATTGFDSNAAYGVATTTLSNGSVGLRLGTAGACDGSVTNCNELRPAWMPSPGALIGLWHLDGSGAVADNAAISGTGPAMVAKNGGSGMNWVSGHINSALELDGTNDYLTAGIQSGSYASGFAFSLWFYWRGGDGGLISSGGWNDPGFTALIGNAGIVEARLNNSPTWHQSTAMTANQWHHLVVSWDAGSGLSKMYIDGALQDQDAVTGPLVFSGTQSFDIGRSLAWNFYFNGYLDEVALWSTSLSTADVATLYEYQRGRVGGSYLSRVMDAGVSRTWTSLAWKPTIPFGKPLPDGTSESTAAYPALVGSSGATSDDNLMDQIFAIWHLDETSGTVIQDSSGNGNHLDVSGTLSPNSSNSILGAAANIGNGQCYRLQSTATVTGPYTFAAWAQASFFTGGARSIGASRDGGENGFMLQFAQNGGNVTAMIGDGTTQLSFPSPAIALQANRWYHVVVVAATNGWRMYLDGTLISSGSQSGTPFLSDNTRRLILGGGYTNCSEPLYGIMDEVAIWRRALHDTEVVQLYRRGISNVKYQVRTCSSATCADDPNGLNWKGPDGTLGTFFSELHNRATQGSSPSGAFLAAGPSISLPSYTSPSAANRYFQYRAILESRSATVAHQPEIVSVAAGPVAYDSAAPAVRSLSGPAYSLLMAISETASCAGGVVYQLSPDGAVWWWWNGSAWAVSNGTAAQSSPVSTLNAHLTTFATQAGTGTLHLRARLQSSGTTPCSLDDIQVDGS